MKHLIHVLLAGVLLSLPLLVRAQQALPPDRVQTGAVENVYVKVGHGVFMDIRLLRDKKPAEAWSDVQIRDPSSGHQRNLLTKVPANTNVRQGDIVQLSTVTQATQSGPGKSPDDPAYLTGRQHCGPAL